MSNITFPLATSTWDDAEYAALQRVIDSGQFTLGKEVAEFESRFAQKMGSMYAVMVNSGSSANLIGLAALVTHPDYDFSDGGEVIVPAVSWATTYYPVTQAGLDLVFVDIDPEELTIDLSATEAAITPRTKAIFAVNLLGNPARLVALKELCDRHNILLLEDNCESLGSTIDGKQTGTFGLFGTYSSFFSHHICTMEGGIICTDDEYMYQAMKSMRAHGWTRELPIDNLVFPKTGDPFEDSFRFVLPGYNVRPIEMMGALGIAQLDKLDGLITGRQVNAASFVELFNDSPHWRIQKEYGKSSWFGFSFVLQNEWLGRRTEVVKALVENGIECRPIVTGNFTKNPVLKHLRHRISGPLSVSDDIDTNGLFVGNHHYPIPAQLELLRSTLHELTGS